MKHIFIGFLSLVFLFAKPMFTLAKDAYAVMSPDSTTLTFYYDSKKTIRKGTAYMLDAIDSIPAWTSNSCLTTVTFDKSFKSARPTSCAYWFAGLRNLTKIEELNNLDTSDVCDMRYMFFRCYHLSELNLKGFNTSNVKNMEWMFRDCVELKELDLSSFDTKNVTRMSNMFFGCRGLTILDLKSFNTSSVKSMNGMFSECKKTYKFEFKWL